MRAAREYAQRMAALELALTAAKCAAACCGRRGDEARLVEMRREARAMARGAALQAPRRGEARGACA